MTAGTLNAKLVAVRQCAEVAPAAVRSEGVRDVFDSDRSPQQQDARVSIFEQPCWLALQNSCGEVAKSGPVVIDKTLATRTMAKARARVGVTMP
jgi:hypothetical protein